MLDTVETELACSLSSILSGKDSLEIGFSVEAILSEESFVSVETGLVRKLPIVFHLAFSRFDVMLSFNAGKVTYMYTYIPETMTDVTHTNDTAVRNVI